MPTLIWREKDGQRGNFSISKSITTIGSGADNDIVIAGAGLAAHHARIVFDGRDFNVLEAEGNNEVLVDGRRRKKARIAHESRIRLGEAELLFNVFSGPNRPCLDEVMESELEGLRRLQEFSAKLMNREGVQSILDELMDAVVQLTDASKGFLVLFEDGRPVIKVARNLHKGNVENAITELSDSIVARVIETRTPLIVSNAMSDESFSKAESVINLRLNSVMCVPLMDRGRLLGIIYVGNDKVTGLFDAHTLELLKVFASQASMLVQNAFLLDELRLRNVSLSEELAQKHFGEIVGAAPSMQEIFRSVEKVASVDVSVLISGETGTGKELIACEIHHRSNRAKGPFITVNCAAIPETLMESELFGHMRGSFTGAVATREGKFQAAHRGTIFLDEIAEMPLSLQVKLLRVLQEHQIVKIGSTKTEPLDIRVIAATNRNIVEEVKSGRFREDLYYRLNVVHIDLPPLRDRGEDVVLLARFLLQRYAKEYDSRVNGFSPDAIAAIRKHPWPGNIREMENRIKRAVILCSGAMIGQQDLDLKEGDTFEVLPLAEAKERFQREYVMQVLRYNNGNRTQTARDLDVDPRTIFRYLEKA